MKQITRISPAVLKSINSNIPEYEYKEEIIVGADATRYRNGEVELSCLMGAGTSIDGSAIIGQTVVGRYNAPASNSLFIIGNGSKMSRSNIVEVSETTFSIKKDLTVKGTSTLESVIVDGNTKITGTLEASTLQVNNNLTVENNLTVKNSLTVNGVIKGAMQNSSGTSYVTTSYLDEYYYTQLQTDSRINEKTAAVATTLNDSITNLSNSVSADITNINTLLANKMSVTPRSIELYGDNPNVTSSNNGTPFIDFHHGRHMSENFTVPTTDYDCRIICEYNDTDDINVLSVEGDSTTGSDFLFQVLKGGIKGQYLDISGDYTSWINHLLPQTNKKYSLGNSSYTWKAIYANDVKVHSDRNLKKDIKYLDIDQYINTFLSLKPCSYIYKDDEDNQTRFGFIAQEVEESFNLLNENKQYALYSKDEETGLYSMSYAEMIALNTCMIQNLMKENDKLKEEIQKLKGNS